MNTSRGAVSVYAVVTAAALVSGGSDVPAVAVPTAFATALSVIIPSSVIFQLSPSFAAAAADIPLQI